MKKIKNRIVIKVGTSTLTHSSGMLNLKTMDLLARVLSDLQSAGNEIILVTSGAIGVGASTMNLNKKPEKLCEKQALASIGQCRIMHIYDKMFREYNKMVGQILLTRKDVDVPKRCKNLLNTFETLLSMNIIPIVNENDSISSYEIEAGVNKIFGDNDTLSAIVAKLCDADILVLISDIDGLYNKDPKKYKDAKLMKIVNEITDDIEKCAGGSGSWLGTGGMQSKIEAAKIALNNNIKMVLTNGNNIESLYRIADGDNIGTTFENK